MTFMALNNIHLLVEKRFVAWSVLLPSWYGGSGTRLLFFLLLVFVGSKYSFDLLMLVP